MRYQEIMSTIKRVIYNLNDIVLQIWQCTSTWDCNCYETSYITAVSMVIGSNMSNYSLVPATQKLTACIVSLVPKLLHRSETSLIPFLCLSLEVGRA